MNKMKLLSLFSVVMNFIVAAIWGAGTAFAIVRGYTSKVVITLLALCVTVWSIRAVILLFRYTHQNRESMNK